MLSLIIKVIRTTPSFKMKDIIHILLGLEAIKSHQSLNILHVLVIYGLTVSKIYYSRGVMKCKILLAKG